MSIQSVDVLVRARDYLVKVLGKERGNLAYEIAFFVNSDRKSKRRATIGSIAGRAVWRNMTVKQVNYLAILVDQELQS
jgi:hypothetical protein